MAFSKRCRYGMRALIDLAQHAENGSTQLNEIARRNSISVKYLEQIFAALRRAGIIGSVKGPQGGYFLERSSGKITVAEIVTALDGAYFLDREEAAGDDKGDAEAKAVQTEVIAPMNEWLDGFLNAVTLKKLVDRAESYREAEQSMYYI